MPTINLYHGDCLEAMGAMPDKAYDLAIVDPPYFAGPEKRQYYGQKHSSIGVKRIDYPVTCSWEVPTNEYFTELLRVSEHRIIWGCNYYQYVFRPGRIVWDKVNGDSSFSDCEIAYCSLHDSVRLFRFMWNGMLQGRSIREGHIQQGDKSKNEKRIHTTQKPVLLYKWQLETYAAPLEKLKDRPLKILDTHGGSMSIAIACHDMGFDLDLWEIDAEYYQKGKARLEQHQRQLNLFPV